MMVKGDRKDARGIAQLIWMGWFSGSLQIGWLARSPGPSCSAQTSAQQIARRGIQHPRHSTWVRSEDGDGDAQDVRGGGPKIVCWSRCWTDLPAMLTARSALQTEYAKLHKALLVIVREDEVCRRLMTTPGVGPLVAITFKTGVDDPSRIHKSKAVGALFGLTPKKYQSGETDVTGGITRAGDEMVRTALYEAASVLLSRVTWFSALKRWGMDVAKRRGTKRAKVALARKIGVILHRMWVDMTSFRWTKGAPTTMRLARV